MEERGREKRKHENAEDGLSMCWHGQFVVKCEEGPILRTEGKEFLGPRKMQDLRETMGDAIGDFRVLKESDDDAEQPEDTSGSDQATGIERARAGFAFVFFLGGGFDESADEAAGKHGPGGGYGKIGSRCKGERANAEHFHSDDQGYAHQDQTPRQALIQNAMNYSGHEPCLG